MKSLKFYHPMKEFPGKVGAAFQFVPGINQKSDICCFATSVSQSKPKPPAGSTDSSFEWKSDCVVRMRLDILDMSKILTVLRNVRPMMDIVHKHNSETKGFKIEKGNNGSFLIKMAVNQGAGWKNVNSFLNIEEAMLFEEFLVTLIHKHFISAAVAPTPKTVTNGDDNGAQSQEINS